MSLIIMQTFASKVTSRILSALSTILYIICSFPTFKCTPDEEARQDIQLAQDKDGFVVRQIDNVKGI